MLHTCCSIQFALEKYQHAGQGRAGQRARTNSLSTEALCVSGWKSASEGLNPGDQTLGITTCLGLLVV